MLRRVLVLHGPNLKRRAETEFSPRIAPTAKTLGVTVKSFQANGEEGLLDILWTHVDEADAVVINAGVLAPHAHALREGLRLVKLRAVEVAFTAQPSLLAEVVEKRFVGDADAYLAALTYLCGKPIHAAVEAAPVKEVKKSIGRSVETPASPGGRVTQAIRRGKSIGRRVEEKVKTQSGELETPGGLTRAKVKEKIVSRLKGKLTPPQLAAWARENWSALQNGGHTEAGAEAVIEGVLLELMGPTSSNDGALITQMAKLDA